MPQTTVLPVSRDAVGATPTEPPVGVAGVDGGGLKRALLTDTSGTLAVNVQGTVPISGTVTVTDGSGPLTVDGTVTANIGTSGSLALDATVAALGASQGGTTSGQKGTLTFGSVTTAAPSYTNGTVNSISLTTGGLLRTDGSGVTQPISAASLPLPTGAATDATVAALGASQGGTTGGQKGTLTFGAVTTSAPSYSNGTVNSISLTPAGLLRVDDSNTVAPVTIQPGLIVGPPTSNTLTATGSIQYQVTPGGAYALTLTNAPTVTATWVATMQFESSPDGTNWSAVSGVPIHSLPNGAGAASATSATAVGTWVILAGAGVNYLRARCSAYTSGTIWAIITPWGQQNSTVPVPFTPLAATGTLIGPLDTSGVSELIFTINSTFSAIISVQGTNDLSGATWQALTVQNALSAATPAATVSLVGSYRAPTNGWKFVRIQVTTYTSGTVSCDGAAIKLGVSSVLTATGNSIQTGTNLSAINNTAPVTAGVAGMLAVGGNIAHSSAVTANPIPAGGRVQTTIDTTLANNDASHLAVTTGQQLIVKRYGSAENDWSFPSGASGIVNTTTAVTLKTAGAASVRNYLTGLQITTDTLGGATELVVRDGAAGTVIWRWKLQTTNTPISIEFDPPLKGTAATLMEVATLTAVTGGVYVNAQGYQGF